jgi:hypothetical protein
VTDSDQSITFAILSFHFFSHLIDLNWDYLRRLYNISVMLWRSVLMVEEKEVPGENN